MTTEFNHKLKAGLTRLGCSALSFSALAVPPITSRKMSQQIVSQIVSGTKAFDSVDDAQDFFGVIDTMEYLQQIVRPRVPINWQNVLELKEVLISIHEQRKNATDPVHRRCWFVRLSVHNFFKGLRSDGSVIETMAYYDDEAVAFTNYELASEVAEKLKQRNIPTKVEMLTCQRRQSTITVALEELGL